MRRFLRFAFVSFVVVLGFAAFVTPVVAIPINVKINLEDQALNSAQHSPSLAAIGDDVFVTYFNRQIPGAAMHTISFSRSTDGGATWQGVDLPPLPANWYWRSEVHLAADPVRNTIWLVGRAVTSGITPSRVGIVVARGFPISGGFAWLEPTTFLEDIEAGFFLIPTLAIAADSESGNAYVGFATEREPFPGSVRLYRTTDGGATWPMTTLEGNPAEAASYGGVRIAIGPKGRVLVGWAKADPSTAVGHYVTRTSIDYGESFGVEDPAADIYSPATGPAGTFLLYTVNLLYGLYDEGFPQSRHIFWTGSAAAPNDSLDVWVNSDCCTFGSWGLEDVGTMLDRPPGSYEYMPTVAQGTDGYYYMAWHDFAPFAPSNVSQVYVTRLYNQGFSSQTPQPLADATMDWGTFQSIFGWMGWKNAAVTLEDRVVFAWSDARGGNPDVYSAFVPTLGFEIVEGCDDTLDVAPGEFVNLSWSIANLSPMFDEDFAYGFSGSRTWLNDFPPQYFSLAPLTTSIRYVSFQVPDTAAAGTTSIQIGVSGRVQSKSCSKTLRIGTPVSAGDPSEGRFTFGFAHPAPNPTHGATAFAFTLAEEAAVAVDVLDVSGRRVARIDAGLRSPGEHRLAWDGMGDGGTRTPAGIYFARIDARGAARRETATHRLVVMP